MVIIMKVLLVNGSPSEFGCTYTALKEIADVLNQNGIETELFHIGASPISGCLGCGGCYSTGVCVIDDAVNAFIPKAEAADGFVFGSPVHYSSMSGAMTSFMDRLFYAGGRVMRHKPTACIASARRAGTTATLDQLNKYPMINEMPVISSQYWNMVHGFTPEDVKKDLEGLQTMRQLGRNMAWILKCIANGEKAGITKPQREKRQTTNFIR